MTEERAYENLPKEEKRKIRNSAAEATHRANLLRFEFDAIRERMQEDFDVSNRDMFAASWVFLKKMQELAVQEAVENMEPAGVERLLTYAITGLVKLREQAAMHGKRNGKPRG